MQKHIIFMLLDMGLWGRTTASLSETIKADNTFIQAIMDITSAS